MNFKITIRYLNIINYPYLEKYLEDMASKGWLLDKIILGSVFIFKKTEPRELEFSISPYEVETIFTRKTKQELEEFETVCEAVGWNYCTKSGDLFIYFKEKGSDALDIHTDEEEEFKLLETIGKKQIKNFYFQVFFLIIIMFLNLSNIDNIFFMKTGLLQIIYPFIPMALVLSIVDRIHMGHFLKVNRENIELGREIEYSDSKFYFTRLFFTIFFLSLFLLFIYVFYTSIFLKNKIIFRAFLPVIIAFIIGQLYRIFVKPSRYSKEDKKKVLFIVMVVAAILSITIGILNTNNLIDQVNIPDRDKYKVLLNDDFSEKTLDNEGTLLENTSILIPRSYEYISRSSIGNGIELLKTDYSKALTKSIAHKLVNLYKDEAKNSIESIYYDELEYRYEEDEYSPYMRLTREEFDELKEKDLKFAIDESIKIITERNITKADNILWNVDEAYFLRDDKTKIILRKGKEVFVLSGKNFDDNEVVKITKEKLVLE